MEERIYQRGQRIGNYEVLDLIATGGFSAVYNVKDLEDHGEEEARPEECALKIGRFDLSSLPEEQRFALSRRLQQEFDLVANLIHMNVVRVFESQWHQGTAFYTMERLKGPTLASYLSEKQRSLSELMLIFRQLTGALAQGHRRGIVHRDLTPWNILITSPSSRYLVVDELQHIEDPDERAELPFLLRASVIPVLIDFGIAHDMAARPPVEPGELLGNPRYMTPDQARAQRAGRLPHFPVPHEDVYGMGVLLYLMLTGQHPLTTPAGDGPGLLEELCDGQPRAPRELNPDAPPALSALALECLAKNGDERPGDGTALRARLMEALRRDAALLQRLAPRAQVGSDTSGGPRPLPDEEAAPAAPGTEIQLQERQRARVQRKLRSVQAMQVGLAAGVVLTIGALALAGFLALKLGGLMEQTVAVARDAATAKADVSRQLAAAHEMLANTQRQLAEQLIQGSRLPVFNTVVLAGLKMPEKPDPKWLRPTPDGRCVDPESGQQLHGCAALRGACWSVATKANPARPCSFEWYDAPPEAPPELKNRCFSPIEYERKPQASTPGTK